MGATENTEPLLRGRGRTDGVCNLAGRIDHTLLKADATPEDAERMCREAREFGFAAVCTYPALLPWVVAGLRHSSVRPCTVVGFPSGATATSLKAAEAAWAVEQGARELDMVLAIWALKSGRIDLAGADIAAVTAAVAGSGCAVKVIIETCLLTEEEKVTACRLCMEHGAAFVKTSTGMAGGGATVADVRLLRATVGACLGVKASGGIRTRADAEAMLAAGADRIGTSSGVAIVMETA